MKHAPCVYHQSGTSVHCLHEPFPFYSTVEQTTCLITRIEKQHIPRGEGIFDVVGGGVDEDSALVPGPALHSDVLVNVAQTLQLTVADHNGCVPRETEER